ncbi:hypothetical protein JCGZ_25654 [Jatropha curcas]|uniref:Uncharacterized protein n=1 Tax=Jatropha curcas TaxID=180498 RepID=A0A067JNI2_JATCU|nr:protein trichome birefringence-like 19 [Jatropha curcas]KDP24358.1 hypothetical protein JCGZ_25654 [Jatropha curcas]
MIIKHFLVAVSLILVTVIPLHILKYSRSSQWPSPAKLIKVGKECNIFHGKWIWYPNTGSHYTNTTCRGISDHQNCIKFGRLDTDFLKWRWKPEQCELSLFNATQFLELVRGKSMAFVGDSLGRNHMESLLCLLATVGYPLDVNTSDPSFKKWVFVNYNFTLASFWSPHLVKAIDTEPNGPTYNRLMNLYLDEANEAWAAQIEAFDYVIISAGRWFYGPQVFFEKGKTVGCYLCLKNNIKNLTMFYGYRRVFRTAFKTLMGLKNFNGVTFLRTLSPSHFENGEWDKGGNCIRTRPISSGEVKLDENDMRLYVTQIEELKRAEREGKKRGLKFRLLDIMEAMIVRADGHPNNFGHWEDENVRISDCVHWCLPGPVDTWNEFLLHMLKMEKETS